MISWMSMEYSSCGANVAARADVAACPGCAQVEDSLEKEVKQVTYELEGDLKSFGKGFTVIEQVRTHAASPVCASTVLCCTAAMPPASQVVFYAWNKEGMTSVHNPCAHSQKESAG